MNYTEKGSRSYLFSIVLVAVLGGLLFGYDTAVISGAEKGLQAFFMGADDFIYTDTWHGITSSSALLGCITFPAASYQGSPRGGTERNGRLRRHFLQCRDRRRGEHHRRDGGIELRRRAAQRARVRRLPERSPLRRGFLCEIVRPCGRIGTIRLSQDNRIVRRMETRSVVRAAGFRCWENARRRVSPTGGDDGRRSDGVAAVG